MLVYQTSDVNKTYIHDIFQIILHYIYSALCLAVQFLMNLFNFSDGPAEDLYGIFINRVRRERPPEFLENIRGWATFIHI